MRPNDARLCPAGAALRAWLVAHKRTQVWLLREIHVNRAVLWQWMTGRCAPRIDNAAQIERLTGIPASMWASKAALRPEPTPPSKRRAVTEAAA